MRSLSTAEKLAHRSRETIDTCRFFQNDAYGLKLTAHFLIGQESALTGESDPVDKTIQPFARPIIWRRLRLKDCPSSRMGSWERHRRR
jgi:hypothetical protein